MFAWCCSSVWLSTGPGFPMKFAKKPLAEDDSPCHGVPKPILKAHSTHTISTTAERRERQHHAVDRPALLHHAAVQDGEAWDAHQADERGGCHLPGGVA